MISNIKTIAGFSLLEVVIALGVLSVGVLGLVKMQAYMEVKAENALKTLNALHIAEAQMEYYQTRIGTVRSGAVNLIPFDELDELESSSAPGTVRKLKHCMDPEFTDGTIFELDCTVSKGVNTLSAALKTINVTVSWADRRGVSQAVSLKTAISKYSEFD